ncbi:FkbO/Hyg5 family chorismatase [Saccharothrix obliqua]|uniref:FkbO/Hyg5 family chorismatase n=1 Tax=Saccharothrix obliqua TaxID=2861747 RepID=UPI001C607C9D|nr:FkbO/Hyg5 family chorismatase [Saccharothrix obliqua]MBW4720310.1 FkbO/Hyg5 family chorismatase [Saccharothrix obliqua]
MTVPTCRFDTRTPPGTSRLAVVHHGGAGAPPELVRGTPHLWLHTDPASGFTETWSTPGPVHSGQCDGLVYAHTRDNLFLSGHVPARGRYAEATERAYSAAFELALGLGFPGLFRMWNLVQDVNGENDAGVENYRDFCVGRAEAFDRYRRRGIVMPAATGIGARGGGVTFYLLATRSAAVTHLENPWQVAAYHYPRRYGPRPPSFARASWVCPDPTTPGRGVLHVAGTASVVGHTSLHPGDVERQCDVALRNVETLIGRANTARYRVHTDLSLADLRAIKVYVRRARDLDAVRARCARAFGLGAEVAFVVADICRRELLVEIEGVVPAAG